MVVVLFLVAGYLAFEFNIPLGADNEPELPAVALGRESVYRVEILLALVYGGLLLLTPLYYGAVRGKLPIEVSARGARWPEAADEALAGTEAAIKRLQQDSNQMRGRLIEVELELDKKEGASGQGS